MDPVTFRAETPLQALIIEHALALAKQLEQTAHDAADGRVLAAVEAFAVPAGRELVRKAVEAALQAQADRVEKKRTRHAVAAAGPGGGTRATPAGSS